jgi:hypothetical protein
VEARKLGPAPTPTLTFAACSLSQQQGLERSRVEICFPWMERGCFFQQAISKKQRAWLGWCDGAGLHFYLLVGSFHSVEFKSSGGEESPEVGRSLCKSND